MQSRLTDKLTNAKCPVNPMQNPEGTFKWLAAKMGFSGECAAVQLGLATNKEDFAKRMSSDPQQLIEELCDLYIFNETTKAQGTTQVYNSLELLSSHACEHFDEITSTTPHAFREYSMPSIETPAKEQLQSAVLEKWEQELLARAAKEGHALKAPDDDSWIPRTPEISSERFVGEKDFEDFKESLELFANSYPLEIEPAAKRAKFVPPPIWISEDVRKLKQIETPISDFVTSTKVIPKLLEDISKFEIESKRTINQEKFDELQKWVEALERCK